MSQFQAFAPGVEVNGETVLSVVDGMGAYTKTAYRILQDNGIVDPKPGHWYPQQSWLDAFREIAEKVGPNTIHQIGVKIPNNAIFPKSIDSLVKALESIDIAYHINHRGGEIGRYGFHLDDHRSATLHCENPYPCEFDRGIIEAIASRFRPPGALVTTKHGPTPRCRKDGGRTCVYHVRW